MKNLYLDQRSGKYPTIFKISGSGGSSSGTGSVDIGILDQRYVFTSSYVSYTSSINGFTSSFSSSVNFLGDQRYILTSSLIQQKVNSYLTISGNLDVTGSITNSNQHLILSSSVDSTIHISGVLDTNNLDKNYHIRSTNGDLILSSSTQVVSSSSFKVFYSGSGFISQFVTLNGTAQSNIFFSSSGITSGYAMKFVIDNAGITFGNNSAIRNLRLQTGNLDRLNITGPGQVGIGTTSPASTFVVLGSASIGTNFADNNAAPSNGLLVEGNLGIGKNSQIFGSGSHLILSSSGGNTVTVSGALDFPIDRRFHIRSSTGHLILSSTLGSVIFVSGTLSSSQGINTAGGITAVGDIAAAGGFKTCLASHFVRNNVAASQTNLVMGEAEATTTEFKIKMPYAGSIISISAREKSAASISAGEITFKVSKNGTGIAAAIDTYAFDDRPSGGYANFSKDVNTFAAGDELGVLITTSADFAPTTLDWCAWLWVEI